jgi:hypothetical protein
LKKKEYTQNQTIETTPKKYGVLLAKRYKQILINMTTKMREVCIKEIEIIMKTTNLTSFKKKIAEN